MATQLNPLREQNYADFFEAAVNYYAQDNITAGRWPASDGLALARAESQRLLSAGLATPEHHLYEIQDAAGGQVAGYLWLGAMARGSARIAYVYQIMVKPEFRRKGHAKAALQAVEGLAKALGLSGMALHVFSHNSGAQALYTALGYQVTSLNMAKPLS